MRRRFRLALLVMLTALSGLCAVALVGSCVTRVVIGRLGEHYDFFTLIDGAFEWWRAPSAFSGPYAYWTSDIDPSQVNTGTAKLRLLLYQFTFSRNNMSFPLWMPTAAFGLWPAIAAIRAIRRRRQQARGFDVTPAKDAADAA
jgi:hypothetical protein